MSDASRNDEGGFQLNELHTQVGAMGRKKEERERDEFFIQNISVDEINCPVNNTYLAELKHTYGQKNRE